MGLNIEFYLENVFSFTTIILILHSFVGILSVWSDILQEEVNCTKDKNLCQKVQENSIKNAWNQFFGKILNFNLNLWQNTIWIFISYFINVFIGTILCVKYRIKPIKWIDMRRRKKFKQTGIFWTFFSYASAH